MIRSKIPLFAAATLSVAGFFGLACAQNAVPKPALPTALPQIAPPILPPSASPSAAAPVADAVAHRPTSIPDRIILTFKGDPARAQAVTWRTDARVRSARAQIALASAYPKFGDSARNVAARTSPLQSDPGWRTITRRLSPI